jgi:hypothetical protein
LQTETWIYVNDELKLKSVDNVHDQKRFVDGKRVDPTNRTILMTRHLILIKTNEAIGIFSRLSYLDVSLELAGFTK